MAWNVSDLYPMHRPLRRRPLRQARLRLEQLEQRLAPSVNVYNWGYGSVNTLVDPNETVLTPTNVKVASFGKLSTTNLDGQVYAQPLIDQGITIGATGGDSAVNIVGATGTQNVVFVATEHDSLYAINDNPGSGAILWQRSFTNTNASYIGTTVGTNINSTLSASTITSVPNGDVNSSDINPEIGITGTPVIDPSTNTLYVLVKTKETIGGAAHYVQRMHAINISDGTDKMQPFLIGDTSSGNTNNTQIFVYGTGDGNVNDPNHATDGNPGTTMVQFNALREANRPALTIQNGQLYAAWASHGDNGPYHGWVVTWKLAGGFSLAGWFCTSPNNGLSGIWSGGTTLQFESDGTTFYFETGNGSGGAPTLNAQGFPTNANYNEALVKVVADSTTSVNHQGPNGWGMKVSDYFIPYNVAALDSADSDFGSGAPLLLPASAGIPGHANLMVAAGKAGAIYLIDRNNMGKFNSVNDNVINAVNDGSGHLEPPNLISGSISTPAYFNGQLYWVSGYSGSAYSYTISSSGIISKTSQTSATFGYLPGSVVVSANGITNGIVWVMDRNLNEIHAYDASTFSTELWNSNMAAGGVDSVGAVNKMSAPTVANGEVFVGNATGLLIYGPRIPPSGVPNAPVLSATTLSGSSINLTWTDSTVSPNTATGYSIEESTNGTTFSVVTTTPAGSTSVALGGLQPLTKYYFRIRGFNSFGGTGYSPYSNTANATTTNETAFVNFPNGFPNTAGLTLNGSASLASPVVHLTTNTANQAGSMFSNVTANIQAFSSLFTFQITPGANTADGFTFTIQGNSATALGQAGGALGYAGIGNSIALKFDLYNNAGEGVDSTGLYTNGATPQNVGSMDLTPSGVDLHSGDVMQVVLTYDGTTLTETIKDTKTNASATFNYPINIPGTVGGNNAYVGFTGGTGGQTAQQDILSWTFTPGATVSPNAPTGLGATPASGTSVNLTWTNNATNQTGFHLDRATDSAFTQNLITENLAAAPNSFTDTASGLAPGGTFYYRLRAYNGAGDSGNSNVSSLTIPLAPPKPTNQQVLSISTTEIDLQWTDNAGHNCDGYHIYRATNGGTLVLIATLPPTSRTAPDPYGFNDTTVSPGTNYNYHIVCFNVSGNNDFAGVNVNSLTNAPTGLTSINGSGVVNLSWTAPTGAASYNVYRGGKGTETLLTTVSGTTYSDTAVSNGSLYYYYVTALNGNPAPLEAESAASSEVPATPATLPADTVNVAYNQTITATWGTGNKTLTVGGISGAIPGLTVPAGGTNSLTISGTPTAAGTETFSVSATDTTGATTTTNYSITVNPGISLSPGTLPVDTVGVAYNQTISSSGGTGTIQLAVSNITGAIPGLTLPSTGTGTLALSGAPTATGTETFKVTATDSVGANTSTTYSITVNPGVTLSPGTLPADTINIAYSQTITASGGTGSLALAVSNISGAIGGLTVPGSGSGSLTISGTPTATGTETFTVTATDAVGATASTNYTIVINRVVTLSPTSLPPEPVSVAYNQTITASGGTGNVTLTVSNVSGSIPGITIPSGGTNSLAISGMPTATGTVTFTVKATDSVGESGSFNYSITINPASALLNMPGSGYSGATNSTLLSYPISISQLADVATPTKHIGLSSASLVLTFPTGLFSFPINSNLATPYVALGSVPLSDTVGAGGANDWQLTANSPFDGKLNINLTARTGDSITSNTGGGTLVLINFPIRPDATLGTFTLTLANNNTDGHTQIVGNNGVYTLSPAPPYTGSVTITQGVQNPPTVAATETYSVGTNGSLSVAAPGLLTGASDPQGESLSVGKVNGSAANVGVALTLASGATLTVQSSGAFVYTPASNFVGPDTFTFQAIDAGKSFSTNTSTVTINVVPTLRLQPLGTSTGSAGETITEQVVLDNPNPSGGNGPLASFNLALTYDSHVLTVASVIPGSNIPGDWTLSLNTTTSGVIAYAGYGSGSGSDLVTGPAPVVLATISFTVNSLSPQSTQVDLVSSASVGTTTVSTALVGSGGTFPLNPTLSTGYSAGVDTTINVTAVTLSVSPGTLPSGTVNTAYNQTISASGGIGPYTFAVTSGTLPPGLTLTSSGVLSGTPSTAAGSPYMFTITATDSGGSTGTKSYSVIVNYPATALSVTAPSTATAGGAFSLTVMATDGLGHTAGGFNGTITLASSAGADISPTSVTLAGGTATVPVTLTKAGFQTITAAASGLTSGTASVTVAAGALGSYLVSTGVGGSSIAAGNYFLIKVQAADSYGNPLSTYSGPPSVTASVSPSSTPGNFPFSIPIGSSGFGLGLGTLQKVGSYTISVASGSFTGTSAPLTVIPNFAAKLGFAVEPVSTPTGILLPTVKVQVEDLYGNLVSSDNTDAVTLGIASGPGSFTIASTSTVAVINGVATFNNLTLIEPGAYTLTELVPTLYTGPNSTTFTVTPLQVIPGSLAGTPSGFSLKFNAPYLVNSTTPVLYGQGFGASAPFPTVTLTQTRDASGNPVHVPISGTLVLQTATNGFTFVATDTALMADNSLPILLDGTYTVDVSSSAATDGFQALNNGGGFLDGLDSGAPGSGDYTATFTVNAAAAHADVVWIPPTADGPGQPLSGPGMNQVGGAFPLYLDDTTAKVTNVQVTVNYDPSLLSVTGVSGNDFIDLLPSSTPGHAVLSYTGPVLPAGDQPFGYLIASVPAGTASNPTPYKAKDLLHLSSVLINGGAIPVVTADAVHLVAYVGDADGTGSYSSNDAVLITRTALQSDAGFTAYPLVDPIIVADTDGSGFIPADAALQVNEAGVGAATANLANPPIPSGVVFQPVANNVDPTVSIPVGLQVGSDGVLAVPVNIDDPHPEGSTGLIEAHLAVTYDPHQFTVTAADIHLGTVLTASSGWSVTPTINSLTGEIAIALSSTTPITSVQGGSLVTIDFHSVGQRASPSSIALVATVNPTGTQTVRTELEDAQGTFTLSPAPASNVVVLPAAAPAIAIPSSALEVSNGISETDHISVRSTEIASAEAFLPEAEGPAPPPPDPGAAHGNAFSHGTPAPAALFSPAPLAGIVFQITGPWLSGLQNAGWFAVQHLADQVFQGLARTANSPIDPVLVNSLRDVEHALSSAWLRTSPASENLDPFNLEGLFGDFGEPATRPSVQAFQPSSVSAEPSVASTQGEQAAADQYFAQSVDEFDFDLSNE
jgi:fibronectin type 3 domain-containing protein